MKRNAQLVIDVTYDDAITTADVVADAIDQLLATALSTSNILDTCGNPEVGCVNVELDSAVE